MDPFLVGLAILCVHAFVCGWLGQYVAAQKGRSLNEGMLLGLFLGIIGVIIAALLPTIRND